MAPSTHYRQKGFEKNLALIAPRRQGDAFCKNEIQRVWNENHKVYGARKIWIQLNREGFPIAPCTTERLMKALGLRGVTRGRAIQHTTTPSKKDHRPLSRQFGHGN